MRQLTASAMFVVCFALIVLSILVRIGANVFMKHSFGGAGRWALFTIFAIAVGLALYGSAQFLTSHAARGLARHARRGFAPLASNVMSYDKRKPILMLRSFTDDDRFMLSPTSSYAYKYTGGQRIAEMASLDEVLSSYLNDYGPVVAIGRPGEWAPPLGAHRKYVSNDWQSEVLSFANDSLLVVMILGGTEGIAWELHQLFRMQCLKKLILAIPPVSGAELQIRWNCFRNVVSEHSLLTVPETLPPNAVFATFPMAESCVIHECSRASNDSSKSRLRVDGYAKPLVSLLQEAAGDPAESYTSPYADTSFYCAVWGTLFFPLGPMALTFGILAILEIRSRPRLRGFKRAIFGIIIGSIGTAIMFAIAIPVMWRLIR